MSDLLQRTREFWYNNEPGSLIIDRLEITRQDFWIHGGPSLEFDECNVCQASEWESRLSMTNFFNRHHCKVSDRCYGVCKKQGSEFWTNFHQDFTFMIGCDDSLNAPKCLFLAPQGRWKLGERFWGHRCDHAMLNLKRQLAQTCQVDVVKSLDEIKIGKYDFLLMQCTGDNLWPGKRPDLPVVMIGWDFWHGKEKYQKEVDLWQPDFFLSSALVGWRKHLQWPKHTKFRFYHAASPGTFFARPNLGEKEIDLLVIGDIYGEHGWYDKRVGMNRQIGNIANNYVVEFSHLRGGGRFVFEGPLEFIVDGHRTFTTGIPVKTRWPLGERVRLLNRWQRYLGSAKFVLFGPMNLSPQIVIRKHYEALASGAVPVMPPSPDFRHLKIEPMVHYIPLSTVWRNNPMLEYFLHHYDLIKQIAEKAVAWHEENADKLIFGKFEDVAQEVTEWKYPRRLL